MSGQPIHPGVVELAGRVLDLARGGHAEDRGQTAPASAVSSQSAETAQALLAAGADPDAGGPSARVTAQPFELPAMTARLQRRG